MRTKLWLPLNRHHLLINYRPTYYLTRSCKAVLSGSEVPFFQQHKS